MSIIRQAEVKQKGYDDAYFGKDNKEEYEYPLRHWYLLGQKEFHEDFYEKKEI